MKKAAVPVPYIIAIVIAIAVIALLGYWFFVIGGGLWGELTEEQCRQKLITYCVQWSANAYKCTDGSRGTCNEENPPDLGIDDKTWEDYESRCAAYTTLDSSQTGCQALLGQ